MPTSPGSKPPSPTEVISDVEEELDHRPESLYPKGAYIMSVLGRSGECFRILGVHYHNFVVVGQERPEVRASEGERLCGVCFGSKAKLDGGDPSGQRWRGGGRYLGILILSDGVLGKRGVTGGALDWKRTWGVLGGPSGHQVGLVPLPHLGFRVRVLGTWFRVVTRDRRSRLEAWEGGQGRKPESGGLYRGGAPLTARRAAEP